ncbi:MAG: hypothetical protein KC613_01895, partial [Myxococcales bacterium]|nr:hypothetical protein [Myxococcales bacterium]
MALALCAAPVVGCDGDPEGTSIRIDLYGYEPQPGEAGEGSGLDGTGLADLLEVQIIDQADPRGEDPTLLNRSRVVDLDLASRSGSIGKLALGTTFRMHLRGFESADESFRPHMYGASVAFDVQSGDDFAVSIQVGPADCVTLNQSSRVTGQAGGTDDLAQARAGASVTVLADGRVAIIGGAQVNGQGQPATVLNSIEVYDPKSNQFFALAASLDVPRAWHTATLLNDGTVLVTGGLSAAGQTAPGAVIVDFSGIAGQVRPVATPWPPSEARAHHQAIKLGFDGSVLIAGGQNAAGEALATAWRFFPPAGVDPAQGQFVRQGDLNHPRAFHSLSPLARQLELATAAGGFDGSGVLSSIEIFTVRPDQGGCASNVERPSERIGCFIETPGVQLAEARWGHRAAQVEDGRVTVFVGGYGSPDRQQLPRNIERLDSSLQMRGGEGAGVGQMLYGRGEASVTALHDDSILVLGGRIGDGPVAVGTRLIPRYARNGADRVFDGYAVAELRANCDLSEPRFGHVAIQQPNHGVVLVLGGVLGQANNLAASRRAELYFPRVENVKDLYR